jgi:hypothetical protein
MSTGSELEGCVIRKSRYPLHYRRFNKPPFRIVTLSKFMLQLLFASNAKSSSVRVDSIPILLGAEILKIWGSVLL